MTTLQALPTPDPDDGQYTGDVDAGGVAAEDLRIATALTAR